MHDCVKNINSSSLPHCLLPLRVGSSQIAEQKTPNIPVQHELRQSHALTYPVHCHASCFFVTHFLCRLSCQIYFWEVLEEDQRPPPDDSYAKNSLLTVVGWKTCGRLLAVVPKAHDGSLTDMCYLRCDTHRGPAARSEKDSSSLSRPAAVSSSVWGNLATCGADGTLRLWAVAGDAPSPLELLMTVDVSTRGVGIGHPRSVSWDRSGTTLALGTVGNAVCLVQPGEVGGEASKSIHEYTN